MSLLFQHNLPPPPDDKYLLPEHWAQPDVGAEHDVGETAGRDPGIAGQQ